jgi:hypothetical protein
MYVCDPCIAQVLGPDVSDIDYVAFTSDQDAYAYR